MKQQPELTVTEQRTDALIPYARNAKIHTNEQVDQICKSIEEFGFNDPVAIWHNANDEMEIVEGHGRVLAASKLGLEVLPTICLDHLTDEQRRAYTHVHNQLNMNTGWDFETLDLDIEELEMRLDLDFGDFGFDLELEPLDTEMIRTWDGRELSSSNGIKDEEYQEFEDKFKPKLTTDDCFTPKEVYDTVLNWACEKYGLDSSKAVRPFYPGGDYEKFDYPEDCFVLDNPPFSILAKILDFYIEKEIPFFLFAPHLTLFSSSRKCNYLIAGVGVIYENKANVNTSFITSFGENKIEIVGDLRAAIAKAQETEKKELPKYDYPSNVITSARLGELAKKDAKFAIKSEQCTFVRKLDNQDGSALFGGGFLISDGAAKAKAKAKAEAEAEAKAEAEKFELSERELEIISKLSEND